MATKNNTKKKPNKPGKGKNARKSRKVNNLVDTIIKPEVRGLKSQRKQVNRDYETGVGKATTAYNTAKADIDAVHNTTGGYLSNLASSSAQAGQDAVSRSQAAAEALKQRLSNTYSGVQSASQAELDRLGLGGQANFLGLMGDAANAQAVADQSNSNAQASLGMANNNQAIMMNLLQGMNAGSRVSAHNKNLQSRDTGLTDLRDNRISALNKINDAIGETRKSRSDLFTQLFNQFQQSGWKGFLKG